jgi:signal transduction histidine kinase
MQRISEMLTASRFPLTSNVLDNMKQLSGAEFLVEAPDGSILSRSSDAPSDLTGLKQAGSESGIIDLETPVTVNDRDWFYARVSVPNRRPYQPTMNNLVHVFVSQGDYRERLWRGIKMPLIVAGVTLPLAFIISLAMASNLTRPLTQVRTQVQEIAGGEIHEIPPQNRRDEIGDLIVSFNDMASRLNDHDAKTRQNERLNTLLQMGTAIAHQLKNCVTGSKMAVELLAAEHQTVADSENLKVALRQFKLMKQYIDRFLSIGKADRQTRSAVAPSIDLLEVLKSVVYLLGPMAEHLNVDLSISGTHCESESYRESEFNVHILTDDAEQMMTNLITNAIEAASEHWIESASEHAISHGNRKAWVRVELSLTGDGRVQFSVTDNGAGPPDDISARMLEPFVTGKQEGTGLGLSLVDEIVSSLAGELKWERVDDVTRFLVVFRSASAN